MAPLLWANRAQKDFLVSRLDKFAEAQSVKTLQNIWTKTVADFFAMWQTAKAELKSMTKGEKRVADTSKLLHDEWQAKCKRVFMNHLLTFS